MACLASISVSCLAHVGAIRDPDGLDLIFGLSSVQLAVPVSPMYREVGSSPGATMALTSKVLQTTG